MNSQDLQLQPYQPTAENPFDALKAAHLLNRAGFGGTREEIEKVLKLGPRDAVDWMLDFPDAPADEQSQTDVPDLSSVAGYPTDFRKLGALVRGKSEAERKVIRDNLMAANRDALDATINWWLHRMTFGPHPLQEKLALFWHGHFVTSAKDERSADHMWKQNELLREHAVGNFRQFVREIARDPAMLDYLNNSQNKKAHPNENFARELMELFTLGIGNYTEDDVKEGARAFTGWAHDGDNFVFHRNEHDTGMKTFLGRTGNFDGDDVIDIILSQPVCTRFVSSKLYNFFVSEEVPEDVAGKLSALLRENDFELRPLIRTILTSNAFYSPTVIGAQIKSPIQLVVGTVRMLDVPMPPQRALMGSLTQMGQVPFAPPNVRGWPGGRMWINTSTLFTRYNTAIYLAGGNNGQFPRQGNRVGTDNKRGTMVSVPPILFDPGASQSPGESVADRTVDVWLNRLVQRPVMPEKRAVLLNALGEHPDRSDNVRKMIQLIVSMPEYQLC